MRKTREEVTNSGCRLEQLLEVVEDEQQASIRELLDGGIVSADCAIDRRQHELGITKRLEGHPDDAVRKLAGGVGRELNRKPRLPRSTRAGQRDEAMGA